MIESWSSFWEAFTLSQLSHFHFLRPWWLLSAIPMFLFFRLMTTSNDLLDQWRGYMSEQMIEHLAIRRQKARKITPKKLFGLFSIIAILVMAGPSWQQQHSPFLEDESVLIIALDVSESMNSDDIQPSRLLRAKQKIIELLEQRGDAKTALIAYAGSAHIVMPITQDSRMIRHFLDALGSDLLPLNTRISQSVLPQAQRLLKNVNSPSTLLLLTDGASNTAISAYQQFFDQQDHQLLVWAIRENQESGASSPEGIDNNQLNQLSSLASAGNGDMITFSHNADDVTTVKRLIKNKLYSANDSALPWYDAGYPLLFILAALQAMWFRRGWAMQW